MSTLASPIIVVYITIGTITAIINTIKITVQSSTVLTMMECLTIQGIIHAKCLISVGNRSQLFQRYTSNFVT